MDQKLIDLYDNFTHGGMNRREFMERLTSLAGSAGAALALLPVLQNNYAQAAFVAPDDSRLAIDKITYDWPKGKVSAYLARPKGNTKRPAVLVIHENRGINPHIEDVARRFAAEGFLALAPDLLSVSGGTPPTEDQAREMFGKTSRDDMVAEGLAGVSFLKMHAESTGKVGSIGFCAGGSILNRIATDSPELDAASVYYGDAPPADKVPAIRAVLLLHYASLDKRVNAGIAGYEAALTASKKRYTVHMYEGANHSFNADVNAARYHKPSADLAWTRTLAFFKEHLGAPPSAS
jgi:carboxymethylenebutenolidase